MSIHSVHHIALVVRELDAALSIYETLLGRSHDARGVDGGTQHAWFRLGNTALGLFAPAAGASIAHWAGEHLRSLGPGVGALAFATERLDDCARWLGRRGLPMDEATIGYRLVRGDGLTQRLNVSSMAAPGTHGARLQLIQRSDSGRMPLSPLLARTDASAAIDSLDHLVIRTPQPERAMALYGARLGFDLHHDRPPDAHGVRRLRFRGPDMMLELVHHPRAASATEADRLWGLAWRVGDAQAVHRRLGATDVELSPLRRSGQRCSFTVHDENLGAHTAVIGAT